jgi:hypothetical protein
VASSGNCGSQRFGVRLVVIADDRVRGYACPAQRTAEEGFGTGAVPFVLPQNIDDLAVQIDGAREVAFVFAAAAEHFIHVPLPSPPSPVAVDCLGQLRAEGLHPIEHRARGDVHVTLRQALHDVDG